MENKTISLFGKSVKLPSHFGKRVSMTVIGTMICAFAVGFFKCSLFGVDPFQTFAQGIHISFIDHFMAYGTYYMIISLLMLIVDLFLDKHYMGLGTLINLFLTGYVVEFSTNLINTYIPNPVLWQRVVMLLIGIVVMCFASALYMTSDMGVSVYDAIPIIISDRKKWPFRFCRIGTDIICVIIGSASILFVFGNFSKLFEYVGIGTIITAFFMGPLVDLFNRTIARPFLYGKAEAKKINEADKHKKN
ncbi:MAG: hypothetical protein Q4C42_06995 [Clostridia bacterium]|nr:hypothetical protein [Clostridia bacterium]